MGDVFVVIYLSWDGRERSLDKREVVLDEERIHFLDDR